MATLRKASDRGHFDHGWLDTHHTFSFAGYRDPAHMGFRSLRVINEDRVAGGHGFGTHGHADMEIFSLVLAGRLEHKDSMGNGAVLTPGELQYMSAGSGVRHSEFNPSPDEPAHFYQVWVEPSETGLEPRYDQRTLSDADGWQTLASPDGADGSIAVRQDAVLKLGRTSGRLTFDVAPGRGVWLQVVAGRGAVDGQNVSAGDGVSFETPGEAAFEADGEATVWLFDLA